MKPGNITDGEPVALRADTFDAIFQRACKLFDDKSFDFNDVEHPESDVYGATRLEFRLHERGEVRVIVDGQAVLVGFIPQAAGDPAHGQGLLSEFTFHADRLTLRQFGQNEPGRPVEYIQRLTISTPTHP